MTVPILAVIAFVMLAGRVVQAQGTLQGATRSGSRAASLARTATDAEGAAAQAVAANLTEAGVACDGTQVSVDTTDFDAGGTVTVRVACGCGSPISCRCRCHAPERSKRARWPWSTSSGRRRREAHRKR